MAITKPGEKPKVNPRSDEGRAIEEKCLKTYLSMQKEVEALEEAWSQFCSSVSAFRNGAAAWSKREPKFEDFDLIDSSIARANSALAAAKQHFDKVSAAKAEVDKLISEMEHVETEIAEKLRSEIRTIEYEKTAEGFAALIGYWDKNITFIQKQMRPLKYQYIR